MSERSRNVPLTDSGLDGRGQIRDGAERAGLAEVLHEASKGQMMQRQAAEQLGVTERHIRHLVGCEP